MTLGWVLQGKALGILILSVLAEVGNSLSRVEAGLGLSTEALEWSKLLMESGIPPFFGKAGGRR